jgi:hypothetical protein
MPHPQRPLMDQSQGNQRHPVASDDAETFMIPDQRRYVNQFGTIRADPSP